MPVSTELIERLESTLASARAYKDRADAEKRDMTAEEETSFDKHMADFEKAREERSKIEAADKRNADLAERELEVAALRKGNAPKVGMRSLGDGTTPATEPQTVEERIREKFPQLRSIEKIEERWSLRKNQTALTLGGPYREGISHPTASPEYRAAYIDHLRTGAMSDLLIPYESRALEQSDDPSGGYTVPPEQFVARLIKAVDDRMFIRELGTGFAWRGAHQMGFPSLDADPADSEWTAELGPVPEDSTMAFGKREFKIWDLTKLLKVSNRLIRNSALDIEGLVAERLAYKTAVPREAAYMTGTGSSQPLGMFIASANGISTGRDIALGAAITGDGLKDMQWSVKAGYNAGWIAHRDNVKTISKLKADGATGQYIWQQGLQAGDPDMLLGRSLYISEFAPSGSSLGDYPIVYGDFSYYWYADNLDIGIQRLEELYAVSRQVGFIVEWGGDGMPVLEEAFARGEITA